MRVNGDPLNFVLPVLWTAQGSYVRRRERVLEICLALRAPGLCKNAVVFSPTVGNMECWAFSRGQISGFLAATFNKPAPSPASLDSLRSPNLSRTA